MAALRIDSNRDGFYLELDRTHRADYFRADLSCGPMEATFEFYEMNIGALRDFFAELAAAWRGWDGELRWRSLEGDIDLLAAHDKLGTVTLRVGLRSDVYEPKGAGHVWTATGLLFLDAGGLDELPRRAAQLVG